MKRETKDIEIKFYSREYYHPMMHKQLINRILNQHRRTIKKRGILDKRIAEAQTWLSKQKERA